VVTTPFDELRRYEGLVRVATDAESFAEAIRSAVENPDDPERLRDRVREETWAAKSRTVLEQLSALGLSPVSTSGLRP
jgi:glycosyltransferase involved in cell wall biosynthesis